MRCGLFGKLPAKRDFIAVSAPRSLLDVWEPWMQSGLSASRELLKGNWQQAYLSAPDLAILAGCRNLRRDGYGRTDAIIGRCGPILSTYCVCRR
jgi:type VI secretion system ImpM family protein